MKKILSVILVMLIGYYANLKLTEQKRDKLVGSWSIDRKIQGGWYRLIMNLKPGGDLVVAVDGSAGGRSGYWHSNGRWELKNSKLSMHFTNNGVPIYKVGEEYGGKIVSLEDKKLTYRHDTGMDTWTRLR